MPHASPTLRFDPILPLHKAMRHVFFDVLTQVGALDTSDIFAVDRGARQVGRLAALLPEAAVRLLPLVESLRQRDAGARRVAAAQLYREVTALVTDQMLQQQVIEAAQVPLLHARHTDTELRAMRREQVSAMEETELAEALRSMACALSPQELSALLDDLQASVDAQTFDCLADTVRRQLGAERWARVARESGLDDKHAAPAARRRSGTVPHDARPTPLQRRTHRADRHRGLSQ